MYSDGIKNAQRILRRAGGYRGTIDGDPGVASLAAANRIEGSQQFAKAAVVPARKVIAAAQLVLKSMGYDVGIIDGFYGPGTDAAYWAWRAAGRREVLPSRPDNHGRQSEMIRNFGQPGSAAAQAGKVVPPWPMVAAWNPRLEIRVLTCHADVAASAQRALERVAEIYTPAEIRELGLDQYGGGYNKRKKRGGTTWSTHALGLAFDFDPARNRLRWNAPEARLSHPDAAVWFECWEDEGWTSLGEAHDFDWMHVQAVAT